MREDKEWGMDGIGSAENKAKYLLPLPSALGSTIFEKVALSCLCKNSQTPAFISAFTKASLST